MAQAEVQTGAACRLLVNGKIIGAATSISYTRDQGARAIFGIDIPVAQEIAITGPYLVTGQVTGLRLRSSGGFDDVGIINAATLTNFFNQKYCTIELVDRKTNVTFAKIHKVIFNVDSVQVSARNVVTVSANFIGTWLSTEASA